MTITQEQKTWERRIRNEDGLEFFFYLVVAGGREKGSAGQPIDDQPEIGIQGRASDPSCLRFDSR